MRRILAITVSALFLLLAGCATTIQSEVTAFHDWPADGAEKSFAFNRTKGQENDLEYRHYEALVRTELQRLGFVEAPHPGSAHLKTTISYNLSTRDVTVTEPVLADPLWYGAPGTRWHGYGHFGSIYSPVGIAPVVGRREIRTQLFTRQLRVVISRTADSKKLYDVSVKSEGKDGSLAAVMPYVVRSAFADFPGKSGVRRQIKLKMKS